MLNDGWGVSASADSVPNRNGALIFYRCKCQSSEFGRRIFQTGSRGTLPCLIRVEIQVRPRQTGQEVEPEGRGRRCVAPCHQPNAVHIVPVDVVVCYEELTENFHLQLEPSRQ